jgi:hypothetical protein
LEGVPPEVVLQIYGYLDADKLLEIENSELHQQIASTIGNSLKPLLTIQIKEEIS